HQQCGRVAKARAEREGLRRERRAVCTLRHGRSLDRHPQYLAGLVQEPVLLDRAVRVLGGAEADVGAALIGLRAAHAVGADERLRAPAIAGAAVALYEVETAVDAEGEIGAIAVARRIGELEP